MAQGILLNDSTPEVFSARIDGFMRSMHVGRTK